MNNEETEMLREHTYKIVRELSQQGWTLHMIHRLGMMLACLESYCPDIMVCVPVSQPLHEDTAPESSPLQASP
jgi:hypothetical protein